MKNLNKSVINKIVGNTIIGFSVIVGVLYFALQVYVLWINCRT